MSDEEAAGRALLRRLVACPLCGRSGGAMAHGRDWCHRCAAGYEPTGLQSWSYATGVSLKELTELSGLSKRTVMHAARGRRIRMRAARHLERVTGIPARTFVEAEP